MKNFYSNGICLKPDEEIMADLMRDREEIELKKKKLDLERKYFIILLILSIILVGNMLILIIQQQILINSLSTMISLLYIFN
jgi:hypothetical protein